MKTVIDGGKRSKILNEVKPVENIRKNPQILLQIIPRQNDALPLHKPQDRAYK